MSTSSTSQCEHRVRRRWCQACSSIYHQQFTTLGPRLARPSGTISNGNSCFATFGI